MSRCSKHQKQQPPRPGVALPVPDSPSHAPRRWSRCCFPCRAELPRLVQSGDVGRGLTHAIRLVHDRAVTFEVEFRNVGGEAAAIGSAGPYTLVVDRPADAGGSGLGFNGGQLLYLAIGGCVSNDLFREASARGIRLATVRVLVRGDFSGQPLVSEEVFYEVELSGNASRQQLEDLVSHVDAIAEIPNSVRRGTPVKLSSVRITAT